MKKMKWFCDICDDPVLHDDLVFDQVTETNRCPTCHNRLAQNEIAAEMDSLYCNVIYVDFKSKRRVA